MGGWRETRTAELGKQKPESHRGEFLRRRERIRKTKSGKENQKEWREVFGLTTRTRERGYGGAAKERKTREGRTTAEENLGETKELG